MNTHGQDTRMEWKVRIRTSLGTIRTEWRLTEESAEALRDRFDVISIEYATRILDF